MEIEFIYKGKDFNDLKNNALSAYKEIGGYFRDAPKNITVRIHKTKKDFNKQIGSYNAYQISALFVQFLIENDSIDKLKQLISSLDKNYYYPNFQKIFQKIFNKDIEDAEKEFINQINS